VPSQERNERPKEDNDEEWEAGDPGCVPEVRHQDVPNRKELTPKSKRSTVSIEEEVELWALKLNLLFVSGPDFRK